jgi:hypothetical protein
MQTESQHSRTGRRFRSLLVVNLAAAAADADADAAPASVLLLLLLLLLLTAFHWQ